MSASRLLIISFSTIASDARVLRQVRRLTSEYEVHTLGYGPAPGGVAGHVRVPDELAIWRYDRVAVAARRYAHAYWSNRAIAFAAEALHGTKWDAVLANDVDTIGLALSLDAAHGVHADLHEYAPRQKENLPRWRFFVAPFMRWMCRRFVAEAASVTTVGQGIADEYAREFGFRAEVVTNAAPYATLAPGAVGNPMRLVHSGAALRDRNITAILDAVEATTSAVRLDLYLTPNDPAFLDEVRARAAASARITLHDAVPYDDLAHVLNAHDIGIHVLPPVNFNNRWALPNKFFDYVQARLGIIIGPSPEMQRMLVEHDLGVVTDDFTTTGLTRTLDALVPSTVAGWKAAADAAASELSGEAQADGWARAIERLMGERS